MFSSSGIRQSEMRTNLPPQPSNKIGQNYMRSVKLKKN